MAEQALYFGIESLNLTLAQRQTLMAGVQQLGTRNNGDAPNLRNHWLVRADKLAVIFEAMFETDTISIDAIKQRLATIFNVVAGTITHSTNNVANIGLVVTFIHSSQNRIRMVCFGMTVANTWPNLEISRTSAQAYLKANAAAWGEV